MYVLLPLFCYQSDRDTLWQKDFTMVSWSLSFIESARLNTVSEQILIGRSAWPWWRRCAERPYTHTVIALVTARREVGYLHIESPKVNVNRLHHPCHGRQLFEQNLHLFIGCGHLWVTDGIWKTTFPHCMFKMEVCWLHVHVYIRTFIYLIPVMTYQV